MGDKENISLNLPKSFNDASVGLVIPSVFHKSRVVLTEEGSSVAAVTVSPFDFSSGGMENAPLNIFGEMHETSHIQAADADLGRRRQLGEMAAEVCRNGMETPVTCMKPLRFRAGCCFSL